VHIVHARLCVLHVGRFVLSRTKKNQQGIEVAKSGNDFEPQQISLAGGLGDGIAGDAS